MAGLSIVRVYRLSSTLFQIFASIFSLPVIFKTVIRLDLVLGASVSVLAGFGASPAMPPSGLPHDGILRAAFSSAWPRRVAHSPWWTCGHDSDGQCPDGQFSWHFRLKSGSPNARLGPSKQTGYAANGDLKTQMVRADAAGRDWMFVFQ